MPCFSSYFFIFFFFIARDGHKGSRVGVGGLHERNASVGSTIKALKRRRPNTSSFLLLDGGLHVVVGVGGGVPLKSKEGAMLLALAIIASEEDNV